jgi:hypothetical protein
MSIKLANGLYHNFNVLVSYDRGKEWSPSRKEPFGSREAAEAYIQGRDERDQMGPVDYKIEEVWGNQAPKE